MVETPSSICSSESIADFTPDYYLVQSNLFKGSGSVPNGAGALNVKHWLSSYGLDLRTVWTLKEIQQVGITINAV